MTTLVVSHKANYINQLQLPVLIQYSAISNVMLRSYSVLTHLDDHHNVILSQQVTTSESLISNANKHSMVDSDNHNIMKKNSKPNQKDNSSMEDETDDGLTNEYYTPLIPSLDNDIAHQSVKSMLSPSKNVMNI